MRRDASILILSWNGFADTVECVESILASEDLPSRIVIIDNGSTGDQYSLIRQWALSQAKESARNTDAEDHTQFVARGDVDVHLIGLPENIGFARGINWGVKWLDECFGDHVLVILNNDTTVEPSMFGQLLDTLSSALRPFMVAPRIMMSPERDRVWNCCGELLPFGLRRYHHAGKKWTDSVGVEIRKVSFATGCCLAFQIREFIQLGGFTEDFFFGEEDFELCHRIRRHGKLILCRRDAVMHHKVGVSQKLLTSNGAKRAYLYYLNRAIDIRRNGLYKPLSFRLWALVYSVYIGFILMRGGMDVKGVKQFLRELFSEAETRDGVSKERFLQIMQERVTE